VQNLARPQTKHQLFNTLSLVVVVVVVEDQTPTVHGVAVVLVDFSPQAVLRLLLERHSL
jgi:hypothetical protein